jgi:radical SAM superfamily enzyme YgiQ (UPF0313 family)
VPSNVPPLGLLTVAAMLPQDWPQRFVDLSVEPLLEEHLAWADAVFLSAMDIQMHSAATVVSRANAAGIPVVAGGPHYTLYYETVQGVDHILVGEAEAVIPRLVADLQNGCAKPVYKADGFPRLTETPPPRLDLLNIKAYLAMPIQSTRGCPFQCEFCDVLFLNGLKPRHKSLEQILVELDNILSLGWGGMVFFVDDNFIGNKKLAKTILNGIIDWQQRHGQPFTFITQASINLADDAELLGLMATAQFKSVFIGIETPAAASLAECSKKQNLGRDLLRSVETIHSFGINVMGGFIIGFDSDPPEIFSLQRQFIENAGIAVAMIGLLSAPPHTPLWKRLEKEGRILGLPSGNNTMDENALNFIPKMDKNFLVNGYKDLLREIYAPNSSFGRIKTCLKHYKTPDFVTKRPVKMYDIKAMFHLFWTIGICTKGRLAFWNLFFHILFKNISALPEMLHLVAMVHHCQIVTTDFLGRSGTCSK